VVDPEPEPDTNLSVTLGADSYTLGGLSVPIKATLAREGGLTDEDKTD